MRCYLWLSSKFWMRCFTLWDISPLLRKRNINVTRKKAFAMASAVRPSRSAFLLLRDFRWLSSARMRYRSASRVENECAGLKNVTCHPETYAFESFKLFYHVSLSDPGDVRHIAMACRWETLYVHTYKTHKIQQWCCTIKILQTELYSSQSRFQLRLIVVVLRHIGKCPSSQKYPGIYDALIYAR